MGLKSYFGYYSHKEPGPRGLQGLFYYYYRLRMIGMTTMTITITIISVTCTIARELSKVRSPVGALDT